MNDETTGMSHEIRKITIILGLIVSGLSLIIFQGEFSTIGLGVMIGALTGMIGFNMIVHMCNHIELYGNPKAKGYSSYVKRYAVYAIIFMISVYKGINVFALFAGMICHKVAILIYVFLHRKEDD